MKPIIPLLLSLLFPTGMSAQQKDIYVDTMATATPMTLAAADTVVHTQPAADQLPQKKRSLMTRFLDYFNDANKEKKNRRFDFSIIGGPHYSTDTKLGLGLVAAGLYRTNPQDTLQPPSNVSLFGDVSTVGFYMLGVRGTHIFPGDKQRIDYTTYFYSFPTDFWGMGYANGDNDDNCSDMKRWQAQMKASWLFQTADRLFIGPTLSIDYIEGRNIERPELLEGQRTKTFNLGVGVTLLYDTRDNLTAPHSGVYLSLMELARPHFLGNHYAFSTTDLRASGYIPVWKGATLAADCRATINIGNPSWGMMALLGNSYSMRGYYEGRYRDKNKIEATIELRQHVWRRNGVVAWAGAGTVFPKFADLRMKHVLPNFGVGYRWEFKKNVNVRLDYGFGKHGQKGFIFNINEAF